MLASFLDYTFSIAVTRITCATLGYVMPEFSPHLATSRVSRSPCYHTPSLSLLPAQARWLFLQIWHRPSKWDGIAVSPPFLFHHHPSGCPLCRGHAHWNIHTERRDEHPLQLDRWHKYPCDLEPKCRVSAQAGVE